MGGALIGSASGAISGLLGRIVFICRPEPEDEAMQRIMDIVVNSLFTVGFSLFGHFTCMALWAGFGRNLSLHP